MKRITPLFVLFCCLSASYSQIPLSGKINPDKHLQGIKHHFTGFNSGQGYMESIYKNYASNSGLEVNNAFYATFSNISNEISWRFPGGTTANFYNRWGSGFGNTGFAQTFGDAWLFTNINWNTLISNYGNYSNFYNPAYPFASTNAIFPFINSITNNKTEKASSSFCLNLVNHYRSVPLINYNTRKETLRDTAKVNAIISSDNNYLDAFNNSTLSTNFKKIVRQNIDAYLTLVNNGVTVYDVEFGNETFSYMYDDNLLSDYNSFENNNNIFSPSDSKIWIRNDGSVQSIKEANSTLWTFARLAKLYKLLLTDTLQKLSANTNDNKYLIYTDHLNHLKFGMPIGTFQNGGFKDWNNFMINPNVREYIGINAYIIHPYLDYYNFIKDIPLSAKENTSASDLEQEFRAIRDTLEIAYNNRFFKDNQINYINNLPIGSEMWYTEWNFNFDWDPLKKVGNTLLHAMYYYDMTMNFYDINANRNLTVSCNKNNPVTLCNYHIPYSRNDTWYSMTRFTKGYNSTSSDPYTNDNSKINSVEYNSSYFTALLLSPILEDSSVYMIDNVNGGFDITPNVSFRDFYTKSAADHEQPEVLIYFNNKSDSDYLINIREALDIHDSDTVSVHANYIYAENLYASMGQTTFRKDDILHNDNDDHTDTTAYDIRNTIQKVFNLPILNDQLAAFRIKKYSLGYLRISSGTTPAVSLLRKGNNAENATENKTLPAPAGNQQFSGIIPNINVYPNPCTTGMLTVDMSSATDITTDILIFDVTGSLVKSIPATIAQGQNKLDTDLTDLAKGVYILKINHEAIKIVLQ